MLESCLIIIFLFVLQDIDTLTYVCSSCLDGRVSVDDLRHFTNHIRRLAYDKSLGTASPSLRLLVVKMSWRKPSCYDG